MDENGVLTVNHGWNCEIDLPAGEYTISVEGATNTITVYGPSFERTINNFPYSSRFELSEQTKILVTCAEPSVITRLQIENGNIATKYTPYFNGLKSAMFSGIKSIGKKLFDDRELINKPLSEIVRMITYRKPFYISAGTYSVMVKLRNNDTVIPQVVSLHLLDAFGGLVKSMLLGETASGNGFNLAYSFTINEREANSVSFISFYIAKEKISNILNDEIEYIMLNLGDTIANNEPYVESVLSLPSAIDCGLGTTIDFESQKIIETYGEYTFNGSETIGLYGAYGNDGYYRYTLNGNYNMSKGVGQNGLCDRYPTDKSGWLYPLSESVRFGQSNTVVYLILKQDLSEDEVKALINGMKIRYPLATPIETPFTDEQIAVGNEYTAWRNGTETVTGNTNSQYAENTLTQEYYELLGGKQ